MISRRSLAAVLVLLSDPFCFWAKSDAKLRPFFELCKFSSIFFENFFQRSAPSERRPGSFSLLRLQRYCYLQNWQNISQEKFKQIFTDFHTPLTPNHLHQKKFSHAKTAPKKQCASRPATHTLYNIRNEFFKKISVLLQFHNKSAQHHEKKGNYIHVVPKKMRWNSVRNLMCVGRYAEKM